MGWMVESIADAFRDFRESAEVRRWSLGLLAFCLAGWLALVVGGKVVSAW